MGEISNNYFEFYSGCCILHNLVTDLLMIKSKCNLFQIAKRGRIKQKKQSKSLLYSAQNKTRTCTP